MDITVGKTYRNRKFTSLFATVKFIGKCTVVYDDVENVEGPEDAQEIVLSLDTFKRRFEEIPSWKPEVGKKAYCSYLVRGNVTVLCVYGNSAWVLESPELTPITCKLSDLSEPQ